MVVAQYDHLCPCVSCWSRQVRVDCGRCGQLIHELPRHHDLQWGGVCLVSLDIEFDIDLDRRGECRLLHYELV